MIKYIDLKLVIEGRTFQYRDALLRIEKEPNLYQVSGDGANKFILSAEDLTETQKRIARNNEECFHPSNRRNPYFMPDSYSISSAYGFPFSSTTTGYDYNTVID